MNSSLAPALISIFTVSSSSFRTASCKAVLPFSSLKMEQTNITMIVYCYQAYIENVLFALSFWLLHYLHAYNYFLINIHYCFVYKIISTHIFNGLIWNLNKRKIFEVNISVHVRQLLARYNPVITLWINL